MKPKILLVDNVPEFLETQARLLEREGYRVLRASNIAEAEDLLERFWIHLAIIDLRMEDEDNAHDISGLILAQERRFQTIPKIILTAYPGYESAVDALSSREGRPSAIDYVAKQKGPEALSEALTRAFAHPRFRVNFSLFLDWHATSPSDLVRYIEPGAESERERLLNRAEELEDLFRRLFYEKDRIRIDKVLWKRAGRVALTVFAFKGAAMDQFVVVCGQNALVVEEAERVQKLAPKAQGETSTTLADKAETAHFAANAYSLGQQADLETIRSLDQVYRANDRKVFALAMQNLFDKTLTAWHQNQPVPAEHALEDLCRERLGLTTERVSSQAIRARWDALVRYLPEFKTLVPDPDAITTLLQATVLEQPALTIKSPGTLTGESILVDADGHVWLTDFADAGMVPQFWDFVTLESTIRFDWVEEKELKRLQEIEDHLLDDSRFSKPETQGIESATARQAVSFIQCVRRHIPRLVGKDCLPYHLGIFFHAVRRVADFDLGLIPKPLERARLAHALLAMAMIAKKVVPSERPVAATSERGLRVDKDGVKRDGKRISLRGQSRALLDYLADPPNQLRLQREIIENVLKEKFDPRDEHQISRLHTAMRRLREKIEYDPDRPSFLLTESEGYRLVLQPDE